MAKAGYEAFSASGALVAATAKTVLFVMAPSSFGVDLKKIHLSMDGVTAGAVPVLVEICTLTGASNITPGTGNTTVTVNQTYGRAITAGFTAGGNATSEPTVLAAIRSFWMTPYSSLMMYDWPLGDTPDNDVSKGFALRLTAPAAVNVRAGMTFERC